ncbi:uncharacterized protein LOC111620207 [Centruroides sculpturatus]|uniref:uncharacterized protein LOC111620207 n=1 Tax=Centruroides sculpturatus TaxID=218467 RepID=UPI000C6E75A6|nr:uncharacterized protein LOC111620207 [Centruroides sculpturatus]
MVVFNWTLNTVLFLMLSLCGISPRELGILSIFVYFNERFVNINEHIPIQLTAVTVYAILIFTVSSGMSRLFKIILSTIFYLPDERNLFDPVNVSIALFEILLFDVLVCPMMQLIILTDNLLNFPF